MFSFSVRLFHFRHGLPRGQTLLPPPRCRCFSSLTLLSWISPTVNSPMRAPRPSCTGMICVRVQADEFWSKVKKSIFVSATPGKFELELSTLGAEGRKYSALGWDEIGDLVDAQAVIRPTGITDPPVDIRPSEGQVSDMVEECKTRGARGERVLVTALTKQMAGENRAFSFCPWQVDTRFWSWIVAHRAAVRGS